MEDKAVGLAEVKGRHLSGSRLTHRASQCIKQGSPGRSGTSCLWQLHAGHSQSLSWPLPVWTWFPRGFTPQPSLDSPPCPSWGWEQRLPLSCYYEPLWRRFRAASQWLLSALPLFSAACLVYWTCVYPIGLKAIRLDLPPLWETLHSPKLCHLAQRVRRGEGRIY